MKITSLCSGRNKPLTTTAKKLTADPIEFLDLVIDHLTARGMMDPKLLYETPFTDFDTMVSKASSNTPTWFEWCKSFAT